MLKRKEVLSMKIKFLSCVLAAALMLISFASCITENPPVEFSNSDTTDDTTVYEGTTYPPATVPTIHSHAEETTRSFGEIVFPYVGPPGDYASYSLGHGSIDMEDFILFNYMGEIQYYDRRTNTFRRFCFDSDCNHQNWQECISLRFLMESARGYQIIQYSEYDDRFYSLRGARLYSFATDGSDLTLECSMGEDGALDQYIYNPTRATNLSIVENYAYLIYMDENSKRHLMRFDLEKNRLHEIKYIDSRYQILACHVINGEAYILVNDGVSSVYKIQYSPSGELVFCGTPFEGVNFLKEAFYRNEKVYYMKDYNIFYVYDFETKKESVFYRYDKDDTIKFHMVTDAYAYFSVTPKRGKSSTSEYGDIYRLDLSTGEATLAFRFSDHMTFDGSPIAVYDIHIMSKNKVMICAPISGKREIKGEWEAFSSMGVVVTVTENGDFRNPAIIEFSE